MIKYAILEIGGKQYKVFLTKNKVFLTKNKVFLTKNKVEGDRPFEVVLPGQALEARVLLLAEGGKIQVGKPYLKEKLKLKVLESFKGEKIRVAKYHAKANYRRIKGFRSKLTKIQLLT